MTIKEQIAEIDKKHFLIIRGIANSVIPIIIICAKILYLRGEREGYIRRRYRFTSGPIEITKKGRYNPEFEVRYNGHLVLACDEGIQYAKDGLLNKRQYLQFYKSGSWETLLVEIYHRVRLHDLEENFDITPEDCDFFDNDVGFCRRDPERNCPCVEFSKEEV